MKKIILCICAIAVFSCKQDNSQSKLIIGKRSLCEIGYNKKLNNVTIEESSIKFNVCPIISFQQNGIGYIKKPNGKTISFKWIAELGNLVLENSLKGDNIISSGTYKVILGKNKSLKLMDIIHDKIYYLN